MNTNYIKSLVLSGILSVWLGAQSLMAQPPGGGPPGGRPPGGGPQEMIKREQQNLYAKLTDLTDDQKLLLDGIYEEYAVTFEEKMQEAFQSRDREKMRTTMEALSAEKDGLIKDVLSEDQFAIYQEISLTNRERRRPKEDSEGASPPEEASEDESDN